MTRFNELSASAAVKLIATGEITVEDLVRDCLARIEEREPDVGAWEFIDPELALKQARERDRLPSRGPLHGIPVGIKDIFETADMPTAYGSPIYRGNRPRADASAVALIRAAGAVIIGKTVTAELGAMYPGKTVNPHNAAHTPGGSSSGSAAAVGDFMVPVTFGAQTAGSLIRPAAFCGVIGYKPSYGTFNQAGLKVQAQSLDTMGLIARSLDDIELFSAVLTSRTPPTVSQLHERAPKIGICRTHLWSEVEASTAEAMEDAATRLAAAGASVVDVDLPASFAALTEAHIKVLMFEGVRSMAYEWNFHREQLSDMLQGILQASEKCSFEDYITALALGEACRAQMSEIFKDFDVLLAPSAAGEAPLGLGSTGDTRHQTMWTFLHVPCVTLPTHVGRNGLPVGVLLVGPSRGDDALLATARWVEERLTT